MSAPPGSGVGRPDLVGLPLHQADHGGEILVAY
jgi:hypothetical protein